MPLGRLCPSCHDLIPDGGQCPRPTCTTRGKTTTARRRALVEVWEDPRHRRLRKACFERDGYTCRDCGFVDRRRSGAGLVADHEIPPVDRHDPLAFELANYVTRCLVCSGRKDGARARRS